MRSKYTLRWESVSAGEGVKKVRGVFTRVTLFLELEKLF
jgi:hypothetical protein